jgi:hypothetical protein
LTRRGAALPRASGRAAAGLALVLGAGMACDAIAPVVVAGPPVNSCPAHPCASYAQQPGTAPTCDDDGICSVNAGVGDALLVIGLAVDSILAPGRTYLTTLERATPETGTCALVDCSPPKCRLPEWVLDANSYLVRPSAANDVGWDLGNTGLVTALPVQATYRPLLRVGASMVDAIDLGLPLDPVPALNVTTGFYPGPQGGPAIQFESYMQPGCYERTLQPYPPLSEAFPPEVKPWSQPTGMNPVTDFDLTKEETNLPMGRIVTIPTFEIGRAEGLDGWTAYLRNTATKRVFSNVAPLRGSLASNVILATNHLAMPGDALDGLELVIAPPAGAPLPTEVFAPQGPATSKGLDEILTYQSLPLPVVVSGRITTPGGSPVPATVIFTATDIFKPTGEPFPPNFEFVSRVTTTVDERTRDSMYSVVLPQGDYAIAVHPADGSSAITVSTRTVGGPGGAEASVDLAVDTLVPVSGKVLVADGRPLRDAVVEVVPTACPSNNAEPPDAATTQSVAVVAGSDACMPRASQTLTSSEGLFKLALDPGGYLLRVRPVEGSHLPWVSQPLVVSVTTGPIPPQNMTIPAPVRVKMTLTDVGGSNPIANAVVRVFTDPSQGGAAIELGRTTTDSKGQYEIDLAPPDR